MVDLIDVEMTEKVCVLAVGVCDVSSPLEEELLFELKNVSLPEMQSFKNDLSSVGRDALREDVNAFLSGDFSVDIGAIYNTAKIPVFLGSYLQMIDQCLDKSTKGEEDVCEFAKTALEFLKAKGYQIPDMKYTLEVMRSKRQL